MNNIIKNGDEQALLTFLKLTKEGKYAKIDLNCDKYSRLDAKCEEIDHDVEYYYSIR